MKLGKGLISLPFILGVGIVLGQTPPPALQAKGPDTPANPTERTYTPKDHAKPPRVLYSLEPEYPTNGRNGEREGTVVLWLIVGSDGAPRDVRVLRSLAPGFDQAAVDAVKKWKFAPATKDGKPGAAQINVEVAFRAP